MVSGCNLQVRSCCSEVDFVLILGQCIPLTVPIVPLKHRNFRENGCPEIPDISVSGSVFRELHCYDKYRKYWNCSAIPKFPELPEITRKLQKDVAYMTDVAYTV